MYLNNCYWKGFSLVLRYNYDYQVDRTPLSETRPPHVQPRSLLETLLDGIPLRRFVSRTETFGRVLTYASCPTRTSQEPD